MRDQATSSATPGALQPGALVDHFRVIRRIGQGGMGEVYLARDLRLGRKVAIKVVRPAALGGRSAVDRFLSEARSTARFNHPNIVTIYAVGEIHASPYVALEFVDGQTLAERLLDGPMAVMEVVRVGIAIAEAVREAHAHEIVHRDLKPENVIIGRDGRPRVLDFGLARVLSGDAGAEARDAWGEDPGWGLGRGQVAAPSGLRPNASAATLETAPALAAVGQLGAGRHDASGGLGVVETQVGSNEAESAICGTPLYMAPEQWRGLPASKTSDIWSLGLMLYEMAAGRHPWAGLGMHQIAGAALNPAPIGAPSVALPRPFVDLMIACLDKTADGRPTAAALCEDLGALLRGARRTDELERGPFRGLMSFDERHADLFFGREAETDAFLERLRDEPVLAVVAHSGSGKSSFVQAGVVPRLREQRRTVVLRIRPGADPMHALATRIATGDSATSLQGPWTSHSTPDSGGSGAGALARESRAGASKNLEADLRASPERTAVYLADLAERENALVLLFVDQMEEVFTLGASDQDAQLFLRCLATAADDPALPVRVCFTLRDDFVGKVAETSAARTLLAGLFALQTPTGDRLRDILQRAAAAVGHTWESAELLDTMTHAVRTESAALPLLQFAGQMMWERRDRNRRMLTAAAYAQIGGVAGALARHADSVLAGMSQSQIALVRTLLLRLVTPQNTRRVLDRSELVAGLDAQAEQVLQTLVDARLVIARGRSGTAEGGQVEIAHEAMIAAWARLSRWLEEARDELGILQEAEQAAQLWDRRGRRDDEVWQGDALREAIRRTRRVPRELPAIVREFLSAGAARESRSVRRKRGAIAVSIAVMAVVTLVLALQNREARARRAQAEAASDVADARRAEALYEGARSALDRLDPLEARARLRSALELRDMRLARPLWWRLQRTAMRWTTEVTSATNLVALSPDGKWVAVGGNDGTVFQIDPEDRALQVLRGVQGQVSSLDFSGATTLDVCTWSGQLTEWDLETRQLRVLRAHDPSAISFVADPRGRWLLSWQDDGLARMVDARTGAEQRRWQAHDGAIGASAVDETGTRIAMSSATGLIRIFDANTGNRLGEIAAHESRVRQLRFVPGGDVLLSLGTDNTMRAFELPEGKQLRRLPVTLGSMGAAAFDPAGKWLAYGGREREIRLMDTTTGEERDVLRGHLDDTYRIVFHPSGHALVSSSSAKDVIYWDLDRAYEIPVEPRGHSAEVHGLAVSPDGSTIVSGGTDQSVRWWDRRTGVLRRVSHGGASRVNGLAWRPGGAEVAAASVDGTIRIWDAMSGASLRALESGSPAMAVSYTPDGRLLASAHLGGIVKLWESSTGRLVREIPLGETRLWNIDVRPDGQRAAVAAADGTIWIIGLEDSKKERLPRGHRGDVWGVSWAPDGSLLSAGEDGRVLLWKDGNPPAREIHTLAGRVPEAEFHPDGKRIAVLGAGGVAVLLDPASGSIVSLRGHRHRDVNAAVFVPGSDELVTAGDDGTVRLWSAADGTPLWRAPLLVPQPLALLTHRGWIDPSGKNAIARPQGSWVSAVEQRARLADVTPDATGLCFSTNLAELELWSLVEDRRVQTAPLGAPADAVLATGTGCLVRLAGGQAIEVRPNLEPVRIADSVEAMARTDAGILIASGREVREVRSDGQIAATFATDVGVTAIAEVGEWIALGYREGGLELVARAPGSAARRTTFEQVPTSAVQRIIEGPMGTVIAGYATGEVGMWDTESGIRVMRFGLHGPAIHLLLRGQQLIAASELGDYASADMREFELDYCSLLREVWANVPVAWEAGRAVRQEPPADHRCAAR